MIIRSEMLRFFFVRWNNFLTGVLWIYFSAWWFHVWRVWYGVSGWRLWFCYLCLGIDSFYYIYLFVHELQIRVFCFGFRFWQDLVWLTSFRHFVLDELPSGTNSTDFNAIGLVFHFEVLGRNTALWRKVLIIWSAVLALVGAVATLTRGLEAVALLAVLACAHALLCHWISGLDRIIVWGPSIIAVVWNHTNRQSAQLAIPTLYFPKLCLITVMKLWLLEWASWVAHHTILCSLASLGILTFKLVCLSRSVQLPLFRIVCWYSWYAKGDLFLIARSPGRHNRYLFNGDSLLVVLNVSLIQNQELLLLLLRSRFALVLKCLLQSDSSLLLWVPCVYLGRWWIRRHAW